MLKIYLSTVATFALAGLAVAGTTPKSHKRHTATAAAPHTANAHTTAKTAATARTKAASGAHHGKTVAHRRGKSRRVARHRYQEFPTPERYQEIQQALVSKGFFRGEANGQWGPDSIDALKRFQTSQNLMPDGKINSLSLIALGLGPKRLTAQSDTTPQPPGAPAQQPGVVPSTPAAPAQ